jgi:hypothetical protein
MRLIPMACVALAALVLGSCGLFGSGAQRYEPPMELVLGQVNTLSLLLQNADVNRDGRLNWFEAVLVLGTFLDQLQQMQQPTIAPAPNEGPGQ